MNSDSLLPDVGNEQQLFPIGTVAEATGVPTVTLRAWERRYDFLRPRRTAKGHRLFTVEQIALVRRVKSLIDSGIPVSRVGELLSQEIRGETGDSRSGNAWEEAMEGMVAAIRAFDEIRLDRLYEEMLSRFSVARVTHGLIIPLLHRIGGDWENGKSGVAEEHFFSHYIRNKLGSRWHHGRPPLAGRRVVAACLPGERHEYGLLFFALVARSRGLDPVLFGADMPMSELPRAAVTTGAAAVVLSCTIRPGWQVVERDLRQLRSGVEVPVFVGGAGIAGMEDTIAATGATPVGEDLVTGVESIYRQIAGGR